MSVPRQVSTLPTGWKANDRKTPIRKRLAHFLQKQFFI
jgi:hypothetical protein